jgi:translation initiation factor IF-3
VIDEDGNALGIMSPQEALRIAQARGYDLVEISPNAKPPVCKIIDYGKFNYERQKKEKQAKKNQSVMHVKEIRFNPNTDEHDVDFKTKHLRQFLMEGHKVKATVMFRGRMITHPEIGRELMNSVLTKLEDIGKLEGPPKMEGRQLIAYLTPERAKISAMKKKESKPEGKKQESKEIKPEEEGDQKPDEDGDNKED